MSQAHFFPLKPGDLCCMAPELTTLLSSLAEENPVDRDSLGGDGKHADSVGVGVGVGGGSGLDNGTAADRFGPNCKPDVWSLGLLALEVASCCIFCDFLQ